VYAVAVEEDCACVAVDAGRFDAVSVEVESQGDAVGAPVAGVLPIVIGIGSGSKIHRSESIKQGIKKIC
jgi:hypothetical protein